MEKDFCRWHATELHIENRKKYLPFYEGEIWLCIGGINIGHEQDGQGKAFLRPYLVLKKFRNETFFGIPLTRSQRTEPYYFPIEHKGGPSNAMLS